MVRVVDASGAVVAEAGRMPPRTTETESLTRDLAASAGGGAFELVLPSGQGPFVRTFNAALLLTGIVTVAALLVAAVFVVEPDDAAAAGSRGGGSPPRRRRPRRPRAGRIGCRVGRAGGRRSTAWPIGSSGRRSSDGAPRATWHTTSPRRPPCSSRSCRRWSTASSRPTRRRSSARGPRPPACRA